jgi:hypothetical protein
MKKIVCLVVASLMLCSLFAQKVVINDANAEVRAVGGSFHAISVSNAIDLYLSQGNEETVAVSAKETKYRDKIITEIKNGTLIIRVQNTGHIGWNLGGQKMKAYVGFKILNAISASGSSDVYVDGSITGNNLSINLSGSSDFKGNVKVSGLTIDQSGSSDATIGGNTQNMNVNLSGASNIGAYDLTTDYCDVHVSGSSKIRITINKELSVDASGSSDVYYKGSAVIKGQHLSGASSIKSNKE